MKKIKMNLQLFDGEPTTTETQKTESASTVDWGKALFDEKGKIVKDAYKVLEPIITTRVNDGIKTWQDNNLSKYVSKEDHDKIVSETNTTITNIKIDSELKLALKDAKYPELILAQIKRDNIKPTENGIIGLNEEIERVKATYPDMFLLQPQGKGGNGIPKTAAVITDENAELSKKIREAAGLK